MKTQVFAADISPAADIIRGGGLVAVPTETVYGLAANGFDAAAVARIFEVKGRPENKPLSLMVHDETAIETLCTAVPKCAFALAKRFWPGPLTIVLKAKPGIPDIVRAGGETIGLRCPNHPKTLELLQKCALPLAAPSANPSGEKSPVTAEQVSAYFNGKIEGIIDGGVSNVGRESTIIDLSQAPYKILREGALSENEVFTALAESMTILGITGGTGCGKTTALTEIRDLGGLIIDCDEVYHRLLRECRPLLDEINARFPGAVPEGTLDTKALGKIVFSDPEELLALNLITHEYVDGEVSRLLLNHAKNGGQLAAIDAIALIESGISARCKATIGVTAPTELRIQRLMKREGISSEYAALRVSAQQPNEFFEEFCDHCISNDGSEEDFKARCKALFEHIISA
ncbi:MAG: L-threonylcarbamoyladenylate synthase [Oscillospiraceae bacterium]